MQSRPRGYESFPSVLPGPLSSIEDELAKDGVGDLALEGPQGLALGLALSHLALEVDPTIRSRIADLGSAAMWMALLSFRLPRRERR